MSDKPETQVDIYLNKLKNNRVLAVIIVGAVVIMTVVGFISGFFESISKLTLFASDYIPFGSGLSIEYVIENKTSDNIEIDRFSDFHLASHSSPFSIYNTPSGRLFLKPSDGINSGSNYQIAPNQTRKYVAEFPEIDDDEKLLKRGGLDIYFVIEPILPNDPDKIYFESVPFHKEVLKNLSLAFTIVNTTATPTNFAATSTISTSFSTETPVAQETPIITPESTKIVTSESVLASIPSFYIVEQNDSLYKIIEKYNLKPIAIDVIRSINDLSEDDVLRPGQVIQLPRVYVIQPNDTLLDIAIKFQTSVDEIMEINKLRSQIIYAGDILILPEGVES